MSLKTASDPISPALKQVLAGDYLLVSGWEQQSKACPYGARRRLSRNLNGYCFIFSPLILILDSYQHG